MRKPLSDAIDRGARVIDGYVAAEGPGIVCGTYAEDIRRYAAHIEVECRGHLDDAQVYVAAHYLLALTRSAVGRDGLSLLALWLSPNLGWADPPTLFERTWKWFPAHRERELAALEKIAELSALVYAQALDAGVDAQEASAEYAEQLFQLSELRAHCGLPELLDFACFGLRTSIQRELAVAVRNFARAYPYHIPPLDSLEKVRATRPARALRGDWS